MKAFISIALAFFLLFSTVGIAKTTHWCMGHEMESAVGFGQKHLDCGMEMPEEQNDASIPDPISCCENTTQHLQVDDDFQLSSLVHSFDLPFVTALLQTFASEVNFFIPAIGANPQYCSPSPPQDLQLLYETYLI